MRLMQVQTLLKASNYYDDVVDGIWGPNTERAVNNIVTRHFDSLDPEAIASQQRRINTAAQLILRASGYYKDKIDGIAGKNTRKAFSNWKKDNFDKVKKQLGVIEPEILSSSNFPCSGSSNLFRHYGPVGKNQARVQLPFTMYLAWNLSKSINSILVHEKVAQSVERAFEKIRNEYTPEEIDSYGFNKFGGSLNVRKMRGGSSWSTHSWGIAIDFDPVRNRLRWKRDRAFLARPECKEFRDIWRDEGWTSLGEWKNYDWMHFQATKRC